MGKKRKIGKHKIDTKNLPEKIEGKTVQFSFSEPILNTQTNLFEIRKVDKDGNLIDIVAQDPDIDTLKQRREEIVKEYVLSLVHKSIVRQPSRPKKSKKQRAEEGKEIGYDRMIDEMVQMRLEGKPFMVIVDDISERYGLSKISVGMYHDRVLTLLREKAKDRADQIFPDHLNKMEELYRWFRREGMFNYAAKVLRAKENLLGLGMEMEDVAFKGMEGMGVGGDRDQYDVRKGNLVKLKELYRAVESGTLRLKQINDEEERKAKK